MLAIFHDGRDSRKEVGDHGSGATLKNMDNVNPSMDK